ncbi:hypothetical protein [Jutongia sp. SJQ-6]
MIQENRKQQSNVIVPDHIRDADYTEDDLVYVVQETGILIRNRGGRVLAELAAKVKI